MMTDLLISTEAGVLAVLVINVVIFIGLIVGLVALIRSLKKVGK